MEHYLIHEKELSGRADLAELIREIDRLETPVGYERLLYPYFFIVPEHRGYVRLIFDSANKLIVPILPMSEPIYRHLSSFCRESSLEILMVERYHDWLDRDGMRLIPLGVLQNIELDSFVLSGTRMRKLRYMVNRFSKLGAARTEEYKAGSSLPALKMLEVMEKWAKCKNNVIWHTALCMEHLLKGELPPGHRAFLTFLDEQLCSIIVIEALGTTGYLMDQEFYDPEIAPLGHMEFAIVEMVERLKTEGATVLSLGATWYPFPFENHPRVDAEGWTWVVKGNERKTLLSRIFEQGQSNYQFKKKFGEDGEPIFAYLPPQTPYSTILHYWSVFYQNSLTPPQLSERLREHLPGAQMGWPQLEQPEERQMLWDTASSIEDIPCSTSPLDLMTDTWFGKNLKVIRDHLEVLKTRAPSPTLEKLRELFPFKHLILTEHGRDAEALFYGSFPQTKKKIFSAIPWTSTLANQLTHGFEVLELPCRAAIAEESNDLFKGEIDLDELRKRLEAEGAEVAMVGLEVLSNATGGHPVRLSHVRELASLLKRFAIPLVLDASRIVRNAVLLREFEPECAHKDVWSIVRDLAAEADYVVSSLTKDFAIPMGGLVATNNDILANEIQLARAESGFSDDSLLIQQSLEDKASILQMIEGQMALTRSLQDRLSECGIGMRTPAYGHAIIIDLTRYTADPGSKESKVELLRNLFIETGIRGGIHQVGKQRLSLLNRCIRLAFPLGVNREIEDVVFEKLKGFFAKRILIPEKTNEDGPIINDFAPFLSEPERQSIYAEPLRKKNCEIAIIGFGGKFPQCDNYYEFWEKIALGFNFVGKVPGDRWNHSDHYDSTIGKTFVPHKTRCQFGAFLNSHDCFDAAFFRLAPEEVVMMDPQERLAMESVWSCIEDAGYVPEQLVSDVGLFAGMTYNEYQKVVPRTTHSCFITSRLAYFFNFHGPAVAVDTGCASSMAAIDAACSNLADGRCRTAVVTGSSVILHPDHFASLSPELSTTGMPESKPFGNADGWIPAEGVVAILLKPMEEAVRDGDHIYAVIKSSLIGHEGKTSWFSAFNPKRQAGLIDANFERAAVHPATVSYVEAAANGSPLGDAIELEGLTAAFGKWTRKKEFCAIGSVKSYVGHGEGVSTMLQLAKVLLQFKAKRIYPLLHRDAPNPNIRIEESPFRFPVSIEEWQQPLFVLHEKKFSVPRRATISSFGGGGNMGHLILEEAPPVSSAFGSNSLGSYFIPVSSGSDAQLLETVAGYLLFFQRIETIDSNWKETYQMLNVMRTLCQGRVMFSHRVVFVASDLQTLKTLFGYFLKAKADPNIIVATKEPLNPPDLSTLIRRKAWHDAGRQWANGTEIDWREFFQSAGGHRVPLPTYRFQKRRFEISKEAFLAACRSPREKPVVQASLSNSPEKSLHSELSHIVKEAFAKVLSATAATIELQAPLDQYGFDSAMVISVAAELEKHFVRVPHTLFFECSTIQEVIDYLRNLHPGKDVADFKRSEISKARTEEFQDSNCDLDQMTEAIMSDLVTVNEVLAQL